MKRLIINILPLLGVALFWRVAHWLSPTIYMTVVGVILFVGLAILYVKQPLLRQTLKWAWLILLGAGLNFAAILGNGGMMPYPHIMSNAWWVWLGDWLPMGLFSPGDILMIIGFTGVAITLIHNEEKLSGLPKLPDSPQSLYAIGIQKDLGVEQVTKVTKVI